MILQKVEEINVPEPWDDQPITVYAYGSKKSIAIQPLTLFAMRNYKSICLTAQYICSDRKHHRSSTELLRIASQQELFSIHLTAIYTMRHQRTVILILVPPILASICASSITYSCSFFKAPRDTK